jgi:hypothetical protein
MKRARLVDALVGVGTEVVALDATGGVDRTPMTDKTKNKDNF